MGARSQSQLPRKEQPVQRERKVVGRFNAKVGRDERTQTANRAIARKQELPLREVVLTLILFAAFCALLYLCLSHVTLDELDEELAAAEVAAAAAAAAPRSKYQHATANSYNGWWSVL